jgi:hypothetical protein
MPFLQADPFRPASQSSTIRLSQTFDRPNPARVGCIQTGCSDQAGVLGRRGSEPVSQFSDAIRFRWARQLVSAETWWRLPIAHQRCPSQGSESKFDGWSKGDNTQARCALTSALN